MQSLLTFTKYFFERKRAFALGVLLSLLVAFSSVGILALAGWFIAASAFSGLTPNLAVHFNYFLPAAMIRFLALTRIGTRYADRLVNHDLTFGILAQLRVWFYEKLIPLSPAKLQHQQSGQLLNRMVNDIDTLDQLYLNVFTPYFVTLALIAGTTGFLAYFSPHIALLSFILMLASTFVITVLASTFGKKLGHRIQATTAELRTTTVNALQGFIDLRLFLKKSERDKLLDEKNATLVDSQRQFALLKGLIIGSMALFSGLTLFMIIKTGIILKINGALLTMMALLLIGVFDQLLNLPISALSLGKTISAANRITAITQEKPAVIFNGDKSILDYDIHLKNISFQYPSSKNSAITNINLMIPSNTHFAITGFSGAGKSTLLNLIARVYDPTQGDILLGNTNLKALSEATLRQSISLVTQHVHIFNASIYDNLTLMNPALSEEHCFAVLEKMCLAELIYTLPEKLNTPMGEFGTQFSGGQIRRIALARALLHDAPILLLDEPSTGLDIKTLNQVWKNCEDIFKHKTLVIATHEVELIERMPHKLTLSACI